MRTGTPSFPLRRLAMLTRPSLSPRSDTTSLSLSLPSFFSRRRRPRSVSRRLPLRLGGVVALPPLSLPPGRSLCVDHNVSLARTSCALVRVRLSRGVRCAPDEGAASQMVGGMRAGPPTANRRERCTRSGRCKQGTAAPGLLGLQVGAPAADGQSSRADGSASSQGSRNRARRRRGARCVLARTETSEGGRGREVPASADGPAGRRHARARRRPPFLRLLRQPGSAGLGGWIRDERQRAREMATGHGAEAGRARTHLLASFKSTTVFH